MGAGKGGAPFSVKLMRLTGLLKLPAYEIYVSSETVLYACIRRLRHMRVKESAISSRFPITGLRILFCAFFVPIFSDLVRRVFLYRASVKHRTHYITDPYEAVILRLNGDSIGYIPQRFKALLPNFRRAN
jgi:hypothetical protein